MEKGDEYRIIEDNFIEQYSTSYKGEQGEHEKAD
jgi:hypothetical protein